MEYSCPIMVVGHHFDTFSGKSTHSTLFDISREAAGFVRTCFFGRFPLKDVFSSSLPPIEILYALRRDRPDIFDKLEGKLIDLFVFDVLFIFEPFKYILMVCAQHDSLTHAPINISQAALVEELVSIGVLTILLTNGAV